MIGKTQALGFFLTRTQAKQSLADIAKAGLGGILAIGVLSVLGYWTGNLWLMAPFGATCVLLFSAPQSPLSQPLNVTGGHLLSSFIALLMYQIMPEQMLGLSLAVGLAIALMAWLRVTHPPAGADPIVIFFAAPGWEYLLFPVLLGSLSLVLVAALWHRLPPRSTYPAIK